MLTGISKHFNLSPDKLSTDQIKEYLHYCKDKMGLFINQNISALKILFNDVCAVGWDEEVKIKRPRREMPLPVILSKQEVLRMETGNDPTCCPKCKKGTMKCIKVLDATREKPS